MDDLSPSRSRDGSCARACGEFMDAPMLTSPSNSSLELLHNPRSRPPTFWNLPPEGWRYFSLVRVESHSISCIMNITKSRLLDPFSSTHHPTAVQTSLYSQASFSKFDPTGRFVAAGLADGSARIWDLDTKSTVRWLEGHVKAVTSVECV